METTTAHIASHYSNLYQKSHLLEKYMSLAIKNK